MSDRSLAEIVDPESELAAQMGEFALDPVGFIEYAFPWGQGPLQGHDGPKRWQRRFFERLGDAIRARNFDGVHPVRPVLMAVASGHGIGKSALVAMLACFIMSTRPRCKIIVTANTGEQLSGKTFAEIAKWFSLCITGHWFQVSTGDLWVRHKQYPSAWRLDGITWQKHKSEAFAGLHAADSTPCYIFDEGSAVPDEIFDVSYGGLTDGEPMEFVFGNPTRNSGRFFQLFHKLRHRWDTEQIDARDCELPNHELHQQWIDDYGEDSDFVRVRVKGQFPRAGSKQLIPTDIIEAAKRAPALSLMTDPLIAGLDIARFGDDESVLAFRKGRDARSVPWKIWRGLDTMQLADRVAEALEELRAMNLRVHQVFADAVGIGAGTADRLRQLGYDVLDVVSQETKTVGPYYHDKAAECWGRMAAWLKAGAALPPDEVLSDQLQAREYDHDAKDKLFLESKDDMRERGIGSPDRADALAYTFAFHVAPIEPDQVADRLPGKKWDYDPYKES